MTAGRSYTGIEDAASDRVVVLNTKLAVRLFGQLDPVGRTMKILGQEFRVIGVYEPPPSLFGGGNDYIVIMPWVTFHRDMNVHWGWANLAVLPTDEATVDEAMDQVTAPLRRARGLRPGQDNTFSIVTQDKFLDLWSQLTGVFFVVMIALSGVGLMVGGVGVVAVMMISVTVVTSYLAPEAAMPMSSWAPRLAAMKARLVIQTGTERPEVRKSPLVVAFLRSIHPMPSTMAKYVARMT